MSEGLHTTLCVLPKGLIKLAKILTVGDSKLRKTLLPKERGENGSKTVTSSEEKEITKDIHTSPQKYNNKATEELF